MVANPQQRFGAGGTTQAVARLTGVSLNVPVEKQFELLRGALPEAKRVGVIYDAEKSAAAIDEAATVAAGMGLELISRPISAEAGLPEAAASLAKHIDVLWAPIDNMVFNSKSAQFVLLKMLQEGIPVMGFSENMAKAGALLALRLDYVDMGRQTAELLETSLHQPGDATMAIAPPRRFELVVNAHVSRLLKKKIAPQSVAMTHYINED
jgi:putative ABC transport system substrate-binding protein